MDAPASEPGVDSPEPWVFHGSDSECSSSMRSSMRSSSFGQGFETPRSSTPPGGDRLVWRSKAWEAADVDEALAGEDEWDNDDGGRGEEEAFLSTRSPATRTSTLSDVALTPSAGPRRVRVDIDHSVSTSKTAALQGQSGFLVF